jgi:hypothetical protein
MTAPNLAAEQAARKRIAASAQQNVDLIFRGAQLVLNFDRRKEYRAAAIADLRAAASSGADAAKAAATGVIPDPKQAVLAMLREMLPGVTDIEQALEDLIPDLAGELASALPYLGPCISIVRGSTNLVKAAMNVNRSVKIYKHSKVVTPGAPLVAVKAMRTVVDRKIASEVYTGTRHIAAGSASIAVTAASLGADYASPIIGAGNALLSFAHNVFLHILDRQEMKQANKAMVDEQHITPAIFDSSPILGCFYVGMVSTSDLIAGISDKIGSSKDWMTDVEKITTQHIHPLQARAAALIQGSRFYLDTPAEGLHPGSFNKATLRATDGSGPGAYYNLVMNKKYNFGRQVSQAKYAVRGAVRGPAERALRGMGMSKLADLVKA